MKKLRLILLFGLMLFRASAWAQQITLDTSLVSEEEGTIEEFWYWSGGFPVLGEDFAPNSTVTVFATDPDGNPWRDFTGTSDADGNFSIQISAKKINSVLGEHIIRATDVEGNTTTATLTVISNIRETLTSSTTPGQLTLAQFTNNGLTIKSTGLEPNAEVKVHIFSPNESGSEIEPSTQKFANENGEFEMDINIFTPSYPWGPSMPEVAGKWRVNVNDWTSENTNYGQADFRVLPNNPSTDNYCTIEQVINGTGTNGVYPITLFEIIGVNSNNSPVNSEIYQEDFTNVLFDLNAGDTYTIRVKGKNSSSFAADTYTLFIDWNQNGILDEDNEIYHEGYLFNSTGEDDKITEFEITIPENAVSGSTRLRILKVNSATTYSMFWPTGACGFYLNNGQVEDYTLNIIGGITLPECTINCPEDITVQAEIGENSAVVEYNLGFDCENMAGMCEITYPGNNFETSIPNSQFTRLANDFDIPEGSTAVVTQIIPNFIRFSYGADIYFYEDNNGIPGDLITSFTNAPYASQTEIGQSTGGTVYEVVIDLPTPLELNGGKYWVVLNAQGPLISWEATSQVTTEVAYTSADGGTTWDPQDGLDGVFQVIYECSVDPSEETKIVLAEGLASGSGFPVGTTIVTHNLVYNGVVVDTCSFEVTVEETMGTEELNNDKITFYPNPVNEILNISHTKEISNVLIFDLSGKQVYTQSINNKHAQINVAHLAKGIYIVKAESAGEVKTFKIVKK